jgi:hypothetical protein
VGAKAKGPCAVFALLVGWLLPQASACCGELPFVALERAVAEEDDDGTWALAVLHWHERTRRQTQASAEYALDPLRSVQVQLGRTREAGATVLGAELEFKALFNHIARDDWGFGLVASIGAQRAQGRTWRGGAWGLALPLSWQATPGVLLHVSAGLEREPGAPSERVLALGGEVELARRVLLFAEAARQGDARLLHAGVRWWVRRERLAVDFSAARRGEGDARANGLLLALAWYDL